MQDNVPTSFPPSRPLVRKYGLPMGECTTTIENQSKGGVLLFNEDTIHYQNFLFALDMIHDFVFYNRLGKSKSMGQAISDYGDGMAVLICENFGERFLYDYVSWTERNLLSTVIILPFLEDYTTREEDTLYDILNCIPLTAELYDWSSDRASKCGIYVQEEIYRDVSVLRDSIPTRIRLFHGTQISDSKLDLLEYLFLGILLQVAPKFPMRDDTHREPIRGLRHTLLDSYRSYLDLQKNQEKLLPLGISLGKYMEGQFEKITVFRACVFYEEYLKLLENWEEILHTLLYDPNRLNGRYPSYAVFMLVYSFCVVVQDFEDKGFLRVIDQQKEIAVMRSPWQFEGGCGAGTPIQSVDAKALKRWNRYVDDFQSRMGYGGEFLQCILTSPIKMNFIARIISSIGEAIITEKHSRVVVDDNGHFLTPDIGEVKIKIKFNISESVSQLLLAARAIKRMDQMEAFLALLKGYENYTGMSNSNIRFVNFSRLDYLTHNYNLEAIDNVLCNPQRTMHNMPLGHIDEKYCLRLLRDQKVTLIKTPKRSSGLSLGKKKSKPLIDGKVWDWHGVCRYTQTYDAQAICNGIPDRGYSSFTLQNVDSDDIYIYARLHPNDQRESIPSTRSNFGQYWGAVHYSGTLIEDWNRFEAGNVLIDYFSNILGVRESKNSDMVPSASNTLIHLHSFNMKTLGDYLQVLDAYFDSMVYHTVDIYSTFTAIPLLYHGEQDFYFTVNSNLKKLNEYDYDSPEDHWLVCKNGYSRLLSGYSPRMERERIKVEYFDRFKMADGSVRSRDSDGRMSLESLLEAARKEYTVDDILYKSGDNLCNYITNKILKRENKERTFTTVYTRRKEVTSRKSPYPKRGEN